MSADPPVPVVEIFDTTLRDGEQAPGCTLLPESKIAVARQLARLGVDIIEAGFPAASEAESRAIHTIATTFRSTGPTVCGMARAIESDVDRAALALRPAARQRIHTFLATSDIHLEHKLRMTRSAALDRVASIVRYARNQVPEVQFSPEDATRSDRDFMFAVLDQAVGAGATILNIPDTVGYATPEEYGTLIGAVVNRYASSGVTVSVHCHDDLGLAVANTIAGIGAGARQAECTINGIGERAGNAALEEVVMALRTRLDRLRLDTRIEARELVRASRLVERRTRIQVPPNKAVVGRNAFAHQSGIHQAGVLRHRATYEIMTRESVGFDRESIVLGKHSGRHALRARLERLGLVLDDQALDQIFPRFKAVADTKRTVSDRDLRDLIAAGTSHSAEEVAAHAG
ncbi:MAG: 2-isopropylmalate synthase [Gemmatimonadales bacterium]